ncbi:MAG: hypothetical protein HGA55_03495 [Methanoregulaceae archaeon]|nr:hypothetical protein [Methanoregulaceae archaeon]
MIHLVIRFDGHLNETRLDCAMEMAAQVEPLVRMRIVEGDPPFFCPLAEDQSVLSVVKTENPDEALQQTLAISLNPVTGPLAHARLIRSDHDLLVLSANHSATDAYGVKALGSRVALLYRAGGQGFLPLKNHHDRTFASVFRLFPVEVREKAWKMFGGETVNWGLSDGTFRPGSPQYRVRTIPPGIISAVKERAGSRGLTMNDVLLSSYIRSLMGSLPDTHTGDCAVLTTQDLRRYLPPDSFPGLANLSVAFELPFRATRESSQVAVFGDVHRAMDERKRGHAGIGAAEGLCRSFSSGYFSVRQRLDGLVRETRTEGLFRKPFFTNMGIIPEGVLAYGLPEVTQAYMLSPIEYPPGLGVAASTSRGSLVLSSGSWDETFPADRINRILDGMMEEMRLFISP